MIIDRRGAAALLRGVYAALALLILAGERGAAAAPSATLSPRLPAAIARAGKEPVAVWVLFADRGPLGERQREAALSARREALSQRSLARRRLALGPEGVDELDLPVASAYVEAIRASGARLRHLSRWLNAASVEVPAERIESLAGLPFVRHVQPVARFSRPEPVEALPVMPPRPRLWGPAPPAGPDADSLFYGPAFAQLQQIGVPAVHDSGFTGAGVIVGMLDTGFRKTHESLRTRPLVDEWDYVFGDGNTQNEPEDDPGAHYHGTGTWAVLGGFAPGTLIGPAYGASFFLAKSEDIRSETPIEEDHYVAALERADSLGVDVTSASLAYRFFDDPGNDYAYEELNGDIAVTTVGADIAVSRGIAVVNAMGNSGPDPGTLWTPADADSIIAVGAVDSAGSIASFSSRGPTYDGRTKPEVCARGVATLWASASGDDTYGRAGGTSLATPLVGGAAALVREAHPEWTGFQVRQALMRSADQAGSPDNARGWGLINVHEAIFGLQRPVFPFPFDLLHPLDADTVVGGTVEFTWRRTRDPQGEVLSYRLVVARDPGLIDTVLTWEGADTLASMAAPAEPGVYFWQASAVDGEGNARSSRAVGSFVVPMPVGSGPPDSPPIPRPAGLLPNFPNPFAPPTTIPFVVAGSGDSQGLSTAQARGADLAGTAEGVLAGTAVGEAVPVLLTVHDLRGRLVRTLVTGQLPPGLHRAAWDGRDGEGRLVGSGVYIVRLRAAGSSWQRRMVMVR